MDFELKIILVIALLIAIGWFLRSPSLFQGSLFQKNGREASKQECFDRLDQLGLTSLEEYWASEQWQSTKKKYRNSDFPQRCLACGSKDYILHHRTYARLGQEELFDLVPLCQKHHQRLHDLLDEKAGVSVKDTHDYLVFLIDDKSNNQAK